MTNNFKLFLIVIVLLSVSLACGSSAVSDEPQTITVEEKVLFQDDFSDPASGWDRVRNEDGIADYTDDSEYRFLVNATLVEHWANPGLNFGKCTNFRSDFCFQSRYRFVSRYKYR